MLALSTRTPPAQKRKARTGRAFQTDRLPARCYRLVVLTLASKRANATAPDNGGLPMLITRTLGGRLLECVACFEGLGLVAMLNPNEWFEQLRAPPRIDVVAPNIFSLAIDAVLDVLRLAADNL